MNILVINSGSSSVKFACIDVTNGERQFHGQISGIAAETSRSEIYFDEERIESKTRLHDHGQAIQAAIALIESLDFGVEDIHAIGHRVVHGGPKLHYPIKIDASSLDAIESVSGLAPLHNPANCAGIRACQNYFPRLPQVACFDTAFHRTIPEVAHRYAISRELADAFDVRKYGFHGISHEYITQTMADKFYKTRNTINLISCHLGNGASITAIKGGKSVDTSMGLTPLAGLIMGTRSGDIDPGIMDYLNREAHLNIESIHKLLNLQSGLKGISEISNDMRTLEEKHRAGDRRATLAIDMFCYRLAHYIGAYFSLVSPLDALVFTGGIGEHSPYVRANTLSRLEPLGFKIDPSLNEAPDDEGLISVGSTVPCYVVPTDEEWQIALSTYELLGDAP